MTAIHLTQAAIIIRITMMMTTAMIKAAPLTKTTSARGVVDGDAEKTKKTLNSPTIAIQM
jgi:hypothetical protein